MRRLAVLLGVLLAAATAFPPGAAASSPERSTFSFVVEDTIDCSQFNPEWTFNDDFVDFFDGTATVWTDAAGNPVRESDHVHHTSNDVNSVTGFTLHEHNHFTVVLDFVAGTVTLSGAINVMQRPGTGEVIHNTGHKILDFATGEPLALHGPNMSDDEDFCAAVAP